MILDPAANVFRIHVVVVDTPAAIKFSGCMLSLLILLLLGCMLSLLILLQ